MKRPRSTPEVHAGASAFSGTRTCGLCTTTYTGSHLCPNRPQCDGCPASLGDRTFEAQGYRFHSPACRAEWMRIERERVGVPL